MTGCAPDPAPEDMRESLMEVVEDPTPPKAAETYDARLHPDPIADPVECAPYLVVTARGTGESSEEHMLSPLTRVVSDARPGEVLTLDLDYPADSDMNEGGTRGVRLLIDTLGVQAEACAEQRFVLIGYSQGAMVVGDALAAPATRLVGATTGELAPGVADRILAVVLYGNPRFTSSETYSFGTFDAGVDGLLPRQAGSLAGFADRLRDYCVAWDFVCQRSLDLDGGAHGTYYDNGMLLDGAAFVIVRLPLLDSAPSAADRAEPRDPG
nr:cutinase family protein [Leucobacter weissii]